MLATEEVTWTAIVGAATSTVMAVVAVWSALRATRSSEAAARDASRALAMLMFPRLLHNVWHQVVDADDKTTPANVWHLVAWNASGWDAVDVEAEVRLLDGRRFSGKAARLTPSPSGVTAPSREDDQLVVDIPGMPNDTNAGYGRIAETVVRWGDPQGIARWESRRDWGGKYTPPLADTLRQIGGPSVTTA